MVFLILQNIIERIRNSIVNIENYSSEMRKYSQFRVRSKFNIYTFVALFVDKHNQILKYGNRNNWCTSSYGQCLKSR